MTPDARGGRSILHINDGAKADGRQRVIEPASGVPGCRSRTEFNGLLSRRWRVQQFLRVRSSVFRGLTAALMASPIRTPVRFDIVREAGTIIGGLLPVGAWQRNITFQPNPGFRGQMLVSVSGYYGQSTSTWRYTTLVRGMQPISRRRRQCKWLRNSCRCAFRVLLLSTSARSSSLVTHSMEAS